MKITALIVTYNKLELLKESLFTLFNQSVHLNNIIVVDNNSTKETKEYLESVKSKIHYIRLNENIGGAGGFNKGFKYFIEYLDDDYLWIMDDDTISKMNTLENLVQELPDNFGFICSRVDWVDGSLANMNVPVPNPFYLENSLVKINSCSFVSVLFPRDIIMEFGYPIKDFFIWGDDVEYTERISKHRNCYINKKSIVVHKMASNLGTSIVGDSENRLSRYYYNYRNLSYLTKKRGINKKIRFYLSFFKNFLKILFLSKTEKSQRIRILFKGYKDGFLFNPEIEKVENIKEKI